MAVKSYAWSQSLAESVADGATVDVSTPGFLTPENYKTDETGVVIDGRVLQDTEVSCAWAGDFTSVTLTNSMGADWNPSQTIYVTVPGIPLDPADIQGSFEALEARVTAVEGVNTAQDGQISTLDARVSALEGVASAAAMTASPKAAPVEEHAKRDEDHGKDHDKGHDKDHSKKKEAPGTPHWNKSDIEDGDSHNKKKK
jgi:hypothetical protein